MTTERTAPPSWRSTRLSARSPATGARVEAALLPLLAQDDVSTGAKDYLCRWLGVIGSDASIPALKKLTADPKLSHLAVYALLDLDTPAARAALLGSLGSAPPPLFVPRSSGPSAGRAWPTPFPSWPKPPRPPTRAEATAALDALGTMEPRRRSRRCARRRWRRRWKPTRQWALLHAADGRPRRTAHRGRTRRSPSSRRCSSPETPPRCATPPRQGASTPIPPRR